MLDRAGDPPSTAWIVNVYVDWSSKSMGLAVLIAPVMASSTKIASLFPDTIAYVTDPAAPLSGSVAETDVSGVPAREFSATLAAYEA